MKRLKLLLMIIGALSVIGVYANDDPRTELRYRLDSLNFEKQERRRQGKAIDDLEAVTAALQDTLASLRGYVPTAPSAGADGGRPAGRPSPVLEKVVTLMSLEGALSSFKPRGAFDWIVVGTGAVALLSGLALILGIVAGMGKKKRAGGKKVAGRKINLAPTRTQAAVSEFAAANPDVNADILPRSSIPADRAGHNQTGEPRDTVADLQNLMENLRKFAPTPPPVASKPEPPPPPVVPEPEPEPPPLIVNAPETPRRTQQFAVKAESAPYSGQDGGPPLPSFNELVLTASKNGLSEQEISRRYQLSVDLVRLILRMSKT